MSESNSNNTIEMAHLDVAPERQQAFLDAEPLVDVDSLDYSQRQTYQRQEVFLEAYVQYGTLIKAAEIANCHYDCASQWRKRDAFRHSLLPQKMKAIAPGSLEKRLTL